MGSGWCRTGLPWRVRGAGGPGCRTHPPSGERSAGGWPDLVLKGWGGPRLLASPGARWQSRRSGWDTTWPKNRSVLARRLRERDWASASAALSEALERGGLVGISIRDRLCFCQDTSSFFSGHCHSLMALRVPVHVLLESSLEAQ